MAQPCVPVHALAATELPGVVKSLVNTDWSLAIITGSVKKKRAQLAVLNQRRVGQVLGADEGLRPIRDHLLAVHVKRRGRRRRTR